MKKLLAAALSLALAVGLCPVSQAAQPFKLFTPEDLKWGVDGSVPVPGYFTGRIVRPTGYTMDTRIKIVLYKEGSGKVSEKIRRVITGESFSDTMCAYFDGNPESGTYYYTAQALSAEDGYTDSDIATSLPWTYVKPSPQLAPPPPPVWDTFPNFTWTTGANTRGGALQTYYSKTPDGQFELVDEDWGIWGGYGGIPGDCLAEHGAGYYRVKVKAQSADITRWQNSDWSDFSEPYDYNAPVSQGQLGNAGELHWTYRSNGELSITEGTIPQDHKVLAACFNQAGCFVDVKILTAQEPTALLRANTARFKLFWLDDRLTPQCETVDSKQQA